MLADLNRLPMSDDVGPESFVTAGNGIAFFTAGGGQQGQELWRTDGTASGTYLVKDIFAGPGSSSIGSMVALGNLVLFSADDGSHGAELWRSDGTPSGTYMLRDSVPGLDGGFSYSSKLFPILVVANGSAYFLASDAADGGVLGRSDGTIAGTTVVKSFTSSQRVSGLTRVGTKLAMRGGAETNQDQLWTSDGTAAGTKMVLDLVPGSVGSYLDDMVGAGSKLYFTADVPGYGRELWVSDLTAAGTRLVVDRSPGTASGDFDEVFGRSDGTLLVSAYDDTHGIELWRSDGTAAGTVLLADAAPGITFSQPTGFYTHPADGRTYYQANNVLWSTDGTPGGTRLVSSIARGMARFASVGNALYYAAYENLGEGLRLFRTDGGSTSMVSTMPVESWLGMAGGNLLFNGFDAALGRTLQALVPGSETPTLLADTDDRNRGSYPSFIAAIGTHAFFTTTFDSPGDALQLWSVDATTRAVTRMGEIYVNPTPCWAAVGSTLYFARRSSNGNGELWRTDGTTAGTVLIRSFANYTVPQQLIGVHGLLMFGINGTLYRSDGTAAGTVAATGGANLDPPRASAEVGPFDVFTAVRAGSGPSLFRSDGKVVTLVRAGNTTDFVRPFLLRAWKGRAYFMTSPPESDDPYGLWSTDGTSGGTTFIRSIDAPRSSLGKAATGVVGLADDPTQFLFAMNGVLWRSDGTSTGTRSIALPSVVLAADLSVDAVAAGSAGDTYFFTNEMTGTSMFRLPAGSALPVQLATSPRAPAIDWANWTSSLTPLGDGRVLFPWVDEAHGRELLVTDGTVPGTRLALDTLAGVESGEWSSGVVVLEGRAYLGIDDVFHGVEPTVVDLVPPRVVASSWDVNARAVLLDLSEPIVSAPVLSALNLVNLNTGLPVAGVTQAVLANDGRQVRVTVRAGDGRFGFSVGGGALDDGFGNASVASTPLTFATLAGDANGDEVVNFADLLTLAQNYARSSRTYAQGDFDHDGQVNFADLLILAQQYGKSLPMQAAADVGLNAVAHAEEQDQRRIGLASDVLA